MKLSLNIHGQNIPDKPRLLNYLQATKPSWALVMDEMEVVRDIKRILPACNVIFRAWPDDGFPEGVTAQEWVTKAQAWIYGTNTTWVYARNEIGFSDEALNWSCEVIEAAVKVGLRVVVGNFSAGTPEPKDWERPAAKRLLELLNTHRQYAVLGLHEYACGVITSGILNPPAVHPLLWPRNITGLNLWHMGRYTFLMRACQKMDIPLPRIVITEFGFDDMSDVAAWRDSLVKTPPHENIRGWQTLVNQWQLWGHWRSPQQALHEQYQYAADTFYNHPAIEGLLIYSWGASSDQWKPFDVSEALEFQSLMTETVTPARPPIPKAGRYIISSSVLGMAVRDDANEGARKQVTLHEGQRLTILPAEPRSTDKYDWVLVDGTAIVSDEKNPLVTNIVNFHGWSAITTATHLKPDVEPPPCPEPVDYRQTMISMIQAQIVLCDAAIKLYTDQINLLMKLSESLTQSPPAAAALQTARMDGK